LRGITQRITISPRSESLPSYPVSVTVLAGATRVLSIFQNFLGVGSSIQIINNDPANTIQFILNNDTINPITIGAGATLAINDQWVEQIEVTAAAGGTVILLIQIVQERDLGLSEI